EPALTGNIHNQQNTAPIFGQRHILPVDGRRFKVIYRHMSTNSSVTRRAAGRIFALLYFVLLDQRSTECRIPLRTGLEMSSLTRKSLSKPRAKATLSRF